MYAFQFSSYDENNFHKKLPNFEGGTSLKLSNLAEDFYIWFYAPRQQKNFRISLYIWPNLQ